MVDGAWIQLPPVPGRPAAGYFNLDAPADRQALVRVTSPAAGRIEMHETGTSDGMSSMRRVEAQPIRHQSITFSPGFRHLMLFDLDKAVKAGDKIPLTFHFAQGEPISGEAEVRAIGTTDDRH